MLDDLIEEGAKPALGSIVASSAATTARDVALGVATFLFLFLMHRSRKVAIPTHAELQLTFAHDTASRSNRD